MNTNIRSIVPLLSIVIFALAAPSPFAGDPSPTPSPAKSGDRAKQSSKDEKESKKANSGDPKAGSNIFDRWGNKTKPTASVSPTPSPKASPKQ